ncbi:phage tail protein, partial [Enterobacter cloacae complex sp.6730661]
GNGNTRTINGMHSAGNHAHTVAIGAHSHTVSGTTESKGSSSAINVTNAYIMLMGWYRVS